MAWFKTTAAEYLAQAEYHRARAESFEKLITGLSNIPAIILNQIATDRGFEAKYRVLAQQANKEGD